MEHFFDSRAKLLITGEYLVLFGARAFGIPLKFKQSLQVTSNSASDILHWTAAEYDQSWFEAEISISDLTVRNTSSYEIAIRLVTILKAAKQLSPAFLSETNGVGIKTNIDFNRKWGLGTSSTLITNIANWAGIDPFELHWAVSTGSGYDIACAQSNVPIMYFALNRKYSIENVIFNPPFKDNIYFIYLEKKQDSAKSIYRILQSANTFESEIKLVSEISESFIHCISISEAQKLIALHEEIISEVIGQKSIQKELFADFPGTIKSLGAWGGDFIMAISGEKEEVVLRYFSDNKLNTVFKYADILA